MPRLVLFAGKSPREGKDTATWFWEGRLGTKRALNQRLPWLEACGKDKSPSSVCATPTCVPQGEVSPSGQCSITTLWLPQSYQKFPVFSSAFLFRSSYKAGWVLASSRGTLPPWGKEPSTCLSAFWGYISKQRQKTLCPASPGQGWTFLSVETSALLAALVITFHLLPYLNQKSSTVPTHGRQFMQHLSQSRHWVHREKKRWWHPDTACAGHKTQSPLLCNWSQTGHHVLHVISSAKLPISFGFAPFSNWLHLLFQLQILNIIF